MIAALAGRELDGRGVKPKRVQRLMREHRLLRSPPAVQAVSIAQT